MGQTACKRSAPSNHLATVDSKMTGTLITRNEAIAQGLLRYRTGRPCKRGHFAERLVSDCACVDCAALKQRMKRKKNPDRVREIERKSNAKHAERVKATRRAHREANRDRILEVKNAWRAANAEKVREQNRQWREANPDAIRQHARDSYERNREQIRERWKKIYAERPEMREAAVATARRRQALKRGAEGTHTLADINAILRAQGHRCAYCRADLHKVKRHIDHIVPIARGGSNDRRNLQATCSTCNARKGAKDPINFARERGLLL